MPRTPINSFHIGKQMLLEFKPNKELNLLVALKFPRNLPYLLFQVPRPLLKLLIGIFKRERTSRGTAQVILSDPAIGEVEESLQSSGSPPLITKVGRDQDSKHHHL